MKTSYPLGLLLLLLALLVSGVRAQTPGPRPAAKGAGAPTGAATYKQQRSTGNATAGVPALASALPDTAASPTRSKPATVAALADGYLPNLAYGERDTPYPTSECRRKSW